MKYDMNIKKHKESLVNRMRLLDDKADEQLVNEFIELYEERCSECQEDRLGCTVRPACHNRNFLNMLIELGAEPEDLPSFCYGQYLEQIKRFILERKGREMKDRRVPTKDFLSTLRVGSIKHFLSRFRKIWTETSSVQEGNLQLISGDDLLFHFDFSRGIVVVNPWHQPIDSYLTFKLYSELLSSQYKINSEANYLTRNWWTLSMNLGDAKAAKESTLLEMDVLQRYEALHLDAVDGSVQIEAEIIANGKDAKFEVRDLLQLYQSAAKLKGRTK